MLWLLLLLGIGILYLPIAIVVDISGYWRGKPHDKHKKK